MKVSAYKGGVKVPIENVANPGSVIIEVVLDDDRTVQLIVNDSGHVDLRGWGNIPGKVGNGSNLSFHSCINKEEQSHCPVCYCPLNCGSERLRCLCND